MAAPGSHLGLSESRTCAFNHYIALITVIPNKYVLKTPTNFITGNIGFGIIPITRRGKTNLRPSRISKDQNALRIINLVIPFKPSVIWNNGYSRGKAKQIEKESILKGIWLRSSEAIIRRFGQIKCKSDGVTSMLNCPWMASHPNTSPRTSSGYMASSLISSPVSQHPIPHYSSYTRLCPAWTFHVLLSTCCLSAPTVWNPSASKLHAVPHLRRSGRSSMSFLRQTFWLPWHLSHIGHPHQQSLSITQSSYMFFNALIFI